jgi:hypothetical protein
MEQFNLAPSPSRPGGRAPVIEEMRGEPVSRILSKRLPPLDDHSSANRVATAVKLPTRASRALASLRAVSKAFAATGPRARPLFGIAPGGACRAVLVAKSAVGSYPTVSPSPLRTGAVSSLWRFPWGYPRRALPGTLANGSPDFPRAPPYDGTRGHPALRAGVS